MIRYDGYIVPYTRVGRERWTERARRYFASRDNLRYIISLQNAQNGSQWLTEPFEVKLYFYRKSKKGDLDNLVKAVLDAAEGVLYPNDSACKKITAELVHHVGPPSQDYCELEIRRLHAND